MNVESILAYIDLELLLTLFGIFAAAVIYRQLWQHLHKRSLKTKSLIDTSLLDAIHGPFYLLLFVLALQAFIPYIPEWVFEKLKHRPSDFDKIFSGAFVVFTLVVFNRFLSNIQQTIIRIEKNEVIPNSQAWVSACKLGRLVSILVFLIVLLSLFNIPMGQILAPTAVGALALSFASKDILSNVFGGLMVMVDKPFIVGNYIKIANYDEGTVRYIGWRITEIQLRNGRILHVPNGVITTATVTNFSEKTHWYIQKEIGLRYQDLSVAADVAKKIEKWVKEHSYANQRRQSFAKLFDLSDSSVVIRVRAYLKSSITTDQWYGFVEDLLLEVNKIVQEHHADFAFPTRTIIMENESASES